ncbi:HAD family hydrolase [Candidatus Lokiarchaeum ossiferum]|uniref:HAD family hydrolase n=1 Tax=Candidatus Lokiarchaeum ossiferum TaxID=2951803 RepID=UPI00352E4AAF
MDILKEKNIKLIIFDYDGVIYNMIEPLRHTVEEGVKKFSLKSNGIQEDMREIFHVLEQALTRTVADQILDSKEMLDIKLLEGVPHLQRLRISAHFYGEFRARTKEPVLFDGIVELIKKLHKRGIKLTILSNSAKNYIVDTMKQYELEQYFNTILGAAEVVEVKPNPEGLNKILKMENIEAKNTIFIGDMISDLDAGKRAGIKTIAVASGIVPYEKLANENPFAIVRDIFELEKFFGIN